MDPKWKPNLFFPCAQEETLLEAYVNSNVLQFMAGRQRGARTIDSKLVVTLYVSYMQICNQLNSTSFVQYQINSSLSMFLSL